MPAKTKSARTLKRKRKNDPSTRSRLPNGANSRKKRCASSDRPKPNGRRNNKRSSSNRRNNSKRHSSSNNNNSRRRRPLESVIPTRPLLRITCIIRSMLHRLLTWRHMATPTTIRTPGLRLRNSLSFSAPMGFRTTLPWEITVAVATAHPTPRLISNNNNNSKILCHPWKPPRLRPRRDLPRRLGTKTMCRSIISITTTMLLLLVTILIRWGRWSEVALLDCVGCYGWIGGRNARKP
mmetsp:Transcript_10828/g.24149  ORF Transcript_10828/g.24149 Transcript_10828/m.24149 type:complete len:237 (-) Transcript_10828:911-1621(-)